jgi:hypothetical protein
MIKGKSKFPLVFTYLLFFSLVGINKSYSQCAITFNPNISPDTIKLSLNQAGVTSLNHNALFGVFVGSPSSECDTVLIFDTSGNAISDNDTMFTCNDIGVHAFQLAIADGSHYFSGNTPDTLSNKMSVFIKVVDESLPMVEVSPKDTVLNCLWLPNTDKSYSSITVMENCPGQITDTSYTDINVPFTDGDTCALIRRVWKVTTQNQGVALDTQNLYIIDTIKPFWDSVAISGQVMSDSVLHVTLDTSLSNSRFLFWTDTTQFKPIAVDSCLGTRTTINTASVNRIYDTLFTGTCSDTLFYIFNATDTKGHFTGSGGGLGTGPGIGMGMGSGTGSGKFHLSVIVKDTTPPVVMHKPFSTLAANMFNLNGVSKDSFLVYVDSNMCSRTIDSSTIRIVVEDAIEKDSVEYRWRIDQIMGVMRTVHSEQATFAKGNNAADTTLMIGDYELTYIYRDAVCNATDSFKVAINVRTWPPILTQGIMASTNTTVNQGTSNTPDTVFAFGQTNMCGAYLDSMAMDIIAQDTFENDTIVYQWKVRLNVDGMTVKDTMSMPAGMFRDTNNAAAMLYPVGRHEVTYLYRDSSAKGCYNVDSVKYIVVIRDTIGTQIVGYPNAAPFGTSTTLTVNDNTNSCSESVTFAEPSLSVFRTCEGPTNGVNITRKFVSGPDADIFDGKPNVSPGTNLTVLFPTGTTVFRYVFTDNIGNMDSIDLTVVVTDQEPPNAVCPVGDQTLSRDLNCMVLLPDYRAASNDKCKLDTVYQYPPVGTAIMRDTMVKLVAVDAFGNRDSCTFPVKIAPSTPVPVVSPLPADSTECNTIEVAAPRAVFNCTDTIYGVALGASTLVSSNPPVYSFAKGINTITWFYSSGEQNSSQTQMIKFKPDVTAPVARCTSELTLYLDTMGMVVIKPSTLDSLSSDNCTDTMNLKMSVSLDTISCDSLNKTFPVYLFVEDALGNKDSCMSRVTIKDNLAPIFQNVPADTIIACNGTIPGQPTLTLLENCDSFKIDTMYMDTVNTRKDTTGGLTIAQIRRDSAYHNYDVIYRWIAEDANGNRDTSQQVIRVRDTVAPKLSYSNPLLVNSKPDATDCSATVNLNLLTGVTDNCSDTVFTAVDFMDGNGFKTDTTNLSLTVPMGRDTIIIRSRDIVGNVSLDTLQIIVNDKTAPRPVCVNAVSLTVNPLGYVVLDSSDINLNSSDNCTPANKLRIKLSRDTFRCADVGKTFTVVMTVTDEAGNFAGCSAQVSIQDFAGAGSFGCPNDTTVVCGTDLSPNNLGFPTVVDVCGINSLDPPKDDTITAVGNACITIRRTWTARDSFGNPTNCTQMIHLIDTIKPTFSATYADAVVTCITAASTADSIKVTDNCAPTYYSKPKDTVIVISDTLLYRRVWTATDGCNTVLDTQNIKIYDKVAPTITLPSDTFRYHTSDFVPDSCGVLVTVDFSKYVTDCNEKLGLRVRHSDPANDTSAILSKYYPVGKHTVTITARDSSGNTANKNVILDIIDNSIPTIVCVENLVVSLGTGGTGVLSVGNVLSSISDNCGGMIDTIFLSQTTFDCSNLGSNDVVLTVRDSAGNEGICIVSVEVVSQGSEDIVFVDTDSDPETVAGAKDGRAWVTVTGGSGTYTVQWNDTNNSTTDTVSNLPAGLYTVVVNDTGTGCRLTDTIRVESGLTVNYEIGDVTGLSGSIIQVPVTVTNFTNVVSVDMSFNIADAGIAQFVPGGPASDFNLGTVDASSFTTVTSTRVLFSGNLDPAMGESKADGSIIFYLNLQLSNAASGSTSLTINNNSSANIETGVLVNNSPVIVQSSTTNGTITIGNPPPPAIFGGEITLENGVAIENVTVNLTGTVTDSDETDANGEYGFTLTNGQVATVRPVETGNTGNGLTVSDLVDIQSHILRLDTLDSPYKMLAADVNGTGTLTISDVVDIQSIILQQMTSFHNMNSWRFVPTSHVFDPNDPWATPIPDSISVPSDSANFIAIKLGDVTLTATSLSLTDQTIEAESRSTFKFNVQDQYLEEGTIIEVPFRAKDFKNLLAYQMTINANPEWLTLEGVTAGALENVSIDNFGLSNANRGLISTLWYDSNPLSIEQNSTLFTLSFSVNRSGGKLSEILSISSDMIAAQAVEEGAATKGIQLAFDEIVTSGSFELFQNRPNPFSTQTIISFNAPRATTANLKFFDFSGRMIHQIKGDYTKGINNIVVKRSDLSGSGILYYELETPDYTARKKMIVLE